MREPIHSGKVSEATLSRSIAVSVIGILLCMICLVGTTWAWYSLSVESGSSDMTGANFDFTVTVTKTVTPAETNGETGTDSTGTTEPVEPDDGYYTVGNEENAIYRVTLTEDGNSTTKNGFCLITVNGSDTNAGTPFYVTIPEAGYITLTITGQHSLKFTPVLGITENSLPDWMSLGNEPAAVGFNQKKEDQIAADPDDKSNEQLVEGTGESSGDKENTEGGGENQAGKETGETPTDGTSANPEPTEPISEPTTETTTQE